MQTRADAYFIIETSKKNLMIKHSYVHYILTISPPPITEIYTELYGWERCDHITEMRYKIE